MPSLEGPDPYSRHGAVISKREKFLSCPGVSEKWVVAMSGNLPRTKEVSTDKSCQVYWWWSRLWYGSGGVALGIRRKSKQEQAVGICVGNVLSLSDGRGQRIPSSS